MLKFRVGAMTNLFDTLKPRTVEIKGARVVSQMSSKDPKAERIESIRAAKRRLQIERELEKKSRLKEQKPKPLVIQTIDEYLVSENKQKIQKLTLRRLRDRVYKLARKLKQAEEELREFQCGKPG